MAAINTTFQTINADTDSAAVIETKAFAFANNMVSVIPEINAAVTAMNFNSTNATSSTSWTVASSGAQAFAIETGKSFVQGMTVKVARNGAANNWGLGDITAASDGSIEVTFRESNGSGTDTDWIISQNAEISTLRTTRDTRTSNTILTTADVGKYIEVTSGTFSQTFSASSSLLNGFFVTYENSGTGVVTLDPNGSETVNGASTLKIYHGEIYHIMCNGSNLFAKRIGNNFGTQEVVVHTGNGYGSTNTKRRRYSTASTETGTDITYADSSTLGATFTINTPGTYIIHRQEERNSNSANGGVGLNASSGTANFTALAFAEKVGRLALGTAATVCSMTAIIDLAATDVIVPHDDNALFDDTTDDSFFRIKRIG